MLTPNGFFDILFCGPNIFHRTDIFKQLQNPPVKLFQPDRSSAGLSFSELPGWMGNAAASPRIHSPTRTNQTQAKTVAGWCYLEGPCYEEILGKKHGGNFGEVNHAWEGHAFLTQHCELCIRELCMLVLIEESCQTKIAWNRFKPTSWSSTLQSLSACFAQRIRTGTAGGFVFTSKCFWQWF